MTCLDKWHGVKFTILTDYYNHQNFGIKALLNRRQARWAGLLAQYKFQIQFHPGKTNTKADAMGITLAAHSKKCKTLKRGPLTNTQNKGVV